MWAHIRSEEKMQGLTSGLTSNGMCLYRSMRNHSSKSSPQTSLATYTATLTRLRHLQRLPDIAWMR